MEIIQEAVEEPQPVVPALKETTGAQKADEYGMTPVGNEPIGSKRSVEEVARSFGAAGLDPNQLDGSYTVQVEKTNELSTIGLIVGRCKNLKYTQELEVKAIKEGLIQNYNENADASARINEGDRIVQVNGLSGDTKAMLAALSKDKTVQLICRPGSSI